jgi:hypothetical protein
MTAFPNLPDKVADFGKPSISPHDIWRQFAEHARFFKELANFLRNVVRDDGALRNGLVRPETIAPDFTNDLSQSVLQGMESLLQGIRHEAARASQAAADAAANKQVIEEYLRTITSNSSAIEKISEVVQARVQRISNLPDTAEAPQAAGIQVYAPFPTGALGPNAGGFYGVDTLGAAATAQDWAQVSIEWAEHMPDTIPPNILAISAITGQHWSSRWWATKAAAAFGGQMAYLYLGPQSAPPTTTPQGDPIPVGAIYYDTTLNGMYVWNGTAWEPFNTPQKSASSVLFYSATAGQTDFPLTTPDMFGNASQPLLADGSQGIEVWLNGARQTPSKGATVVDFTVNVATSTVSLTEAASAGAVLAVDVLTPASAFAPSNVALVKIKIVPDGTTTTFPLLDASNNPYHSTNAAQFVVSVDGSPQDPGVDYTMSGDGNSIVFTTAPAADSVAFAVIAY